MYQYTAVQWLFFFYFYCFFGWCLESAYVSIRLRKLTNRGFMRGPFLPIYGSGAIIMLFAAIPFKGNIPLTFIAGSICATTLEYVTGVVMEALFKVRYWDYSKEKFNFQGHICLASSVTWGVLTILLNKFIHTHVSKFVLPIPSHILTVMTLVLTAFIFSDFTISVKSAIDLKNILEKMEQTKSELVHIQKRLDVIIALTNNDIANRKEKFAENMADLRRGIENRFESLKHAKKSGNDYSENINDEIEELNEKYAVNIEKRRDYGNLKDFFQRSLIRSNPSMTSAKFKEALEELKKKASDKNAKIK